MQKIMIMGVELLVALCLVSCGKGTEANPSSGVDNETIQTIMQRKSVRAVTDQAIPAEYMDAMLKAAMAAPTGSNIQPWHFVVLTDKSQYERVFENNFNMRIFNTAAAVVVFCADTTVTRPPRDNPDGAPVTRPNGTWRDDMGACTENFLLAAESLGLGAVWTAAYPYSDRYASMKRELGMPDTVLPYCAASCAHSSASK